MVLEYGNILVGVEEDEKGNQKWTTRCGAEPSREDGF